MNDLYTDIYNRAIVKLANIQLQQPKISDAQVKTALDANAILEYLKANPAVAGAVLGGGIGAAGGAANGLYQGDGNTLRDMAIGGVGGAALGAGAGYGYGYLNTPSVIEQATKLRTMGSKHMPQERMDPMKTGSVKTALDANAILEYLKANPAVAGAVLGGGIGAAGGAANGLYQGDGNTLRDMAIGGVGGAALGAGAGYGYGKYYDPAKAVTTSVPQTPGHSVSYEDLNALANGEMPYNKEGSINKEAIKQMVREVLAGY